MFESNHKENKSTVQCTVHLYSLLIDYLMADFKDSQIRHLGAEILWKNVLTCSDRTTGAEKQLCWVYVVVGGGGIKPNTATSRSFAFAFASTTLSIYIFHCIFLVVRLTDLMHHWNKMFPIINFILLSNFYWQDKIWHPTLTLVQLWSLLTWTWFLWYSQPNSQPPLPPLQPRKWFCETS